MLRRSIPSRTPIARLLARARSRTGSVARPSTPVAARVSCRRSSALGRLVAMSDFQGVIGRDWRTSTPWWPPDAEPPAGARSALMLVLDDVGFAQLGCYGSDIATPVFDGLAANGVRLANFHTTALCSPTRSCVLTGRNHHRNGMGRVSDLAVGYPGYWGRIPRENGFLSETLRANGYATYAVGKWHLTPDDETHMAASRSSWPLA